MSFSIKTDITISYETMEYYISKLIFSYKYKNSLFSVLIQILGVNKRLFSLINIIFLLY